MITFDAHGNIIELFYENQQWTSDKYCYLLERRPITTNPPVFLSCLNTNVKVICKKAK